MANGKLRNGLLAYSTTSTTYSVPANTLTKLTESSVKGPCIVTAAYDFNTSSGVQEIRIYVDGAEYAGQARQAVQGLLTVTAVCSPSTKVEVYVKDSGTENNRPYRCIIVK